MFAYNPITDTGRMLGAYMSRDYGGLASGDIGATLDIYRPPGYCDPPRVYIGDYKTGRQDYMTHRKQLLTGALAAAAYTGVRCARIEAIYVRPDGQIWRTAEDVDAYTLDVHRDWLCRVMDKALEASKQANPDTVMGDHCGYCPARPHCPGWRGQLEAVGSKLVQLRNQPLTRSNVGQYYAQFRRFKVVFRALDRLFANWVRQVGPIPFEAGEGATGTLELKDTAGRPKIDGERSYELIAQAHGVAVADDCLERSGTIKGIMAGLRMHGIPAGPTLQTLRDQGGILKGTPGKRLKEVLALGEEVEEYGGEGDGD
jgi:hypothetical protein